MHRRQKLGRWGEEVARRYLRSQGYRILACNYHCPLGEIDLVAEEGGTVVFVEVKTRTSQSYGPPQQAVGYHKQHKLQQVAWYYLLEQGWTDRPCRFDIVAITRQQDAALPAIELIKDAFQVQE
ncbi:MAG: YraN family protein [Nitrospinota bacterium]|nr:MAG: YraN family protein [Nitrospinota bacterium]